MIQQVKEIAAKIENLGLVPGPQMEKGEDQICKLSSHPSPLQAFSDECTHRHTHTHTHRDTKPHVHK